MPRTAVPSRAGTAATGPVETAPRHRSAPLLVAGLVVVGLGLLVVCVMSLALGSRDIEPGLVRDVFLGGDAAAADKATLLEMRVPRTALGLAVGAALGLSGALLQGVTRNPLADPGIMGINAGAAACVVLGVMVLGISAPAQTVWLGMAGAAVATFAVYGVASFGREGATPVKLALAGAAVTALLSSLTSAIVLTNVEALNTLRFWQVGALAGRYASVFWQTVPFIVVGVVVALGAGRALNGLALGDDVARALGQRIVLTRSVVFVAVAVLCGAAVAACGPITFVGLIVPHVARMICGPDYRWILAYSVFLAPLVLLAADIAGRLVLDRGELQVGVVLGVVGAPVFVALVRYRDAVRL